VALTVAAGLGVLDAARALGAQGAALDWPNDVVLDGAKLAGVLVETRGLDPATPAYVVGVGLNVAQRTFPPELLLERPVTSLALAGVGASLPEVEAAVLEHLTRSLTRIGSDVAGLARDYLAAGRFQGLVSAATGQETLVGQILELDLDQGLLLETDTGRRRLPLDRLRRLEAAGRAPGAQ
jgi:BirA family biotin operon repressor/biotin-[acetyl-CoA-carboxylase] ligase